MAASKFQNVSRYFFPLLLTRIRCRPGHIRAQKEITIIILFQRKVIICTYALFSRFMENAFAIICDSYILNNGDDKEAFIFFLF